MLNTRIAVRALFLVCCLLLLGASDDHAQRLEKLRAKYLDAKQQHSGSVDKFNAATKEYREAIESYKEDLLPHVLKPHIDLLNSEDSKDISVTRAEYGALGHSVDVTEQARKFILDGQPVPADCNQLGIADPANGLRKSLKLNVLIGGREMTFTTSDGILHSSFCISLTFW